jgi:hypothetical protein
MGNTDSAGTGSQPQAGGAPRRGWLQVGARCQYIYKGPHGFSAWPELFPARVLGFTPKRVKIETTDGSEVFTASVRPESLVPVGVKRGDLPRVWLTPL